MSTCLLRGSSTPAIRAILSPCYFSDRFTVWLWPSSRSLKIYPCLCLCFEFSQITRTTPLRCTILHLSQIFFTDARTFIVCRSLFFEPAAALPGRSSLFYLVIE